MAGDNGKQQANGDGATLNMNGLYGGGLDPISLGRFEKLVENITSLRRQFGQGLIDPRRDIDDECGFPKIDQYIPIEIFSQLYDREAIAARVVEVLPKETWKVQPLVFEDEDNEVITPFEKAWDQVSQILRGEQSHYKDEAGSPIWEYLQRVDILSGIGSYGCLLLGLNDGLDLSMPVKGVEEENSGTMEAEYDNATGKQAKDEKTGKAKYKEEKPTGVTTNARGQTTWPIYKLTINLGEDDPNPKPKAKKKPSELDPQMGLDPEGGIDVAGQGSDAGGPLTGPDMTKRDQATGEDGEEKPEGMGEDGTPKRKLQYLRCFPEHLAQVTQWESNPTSPRYGQPKMYLLYFYDPRDMLSGQGAPLGSRQVHWTRVIHVNDTNHTAGTNEYYSVPRMRPVLNHLLTLRKLYAGSGEMYWRGAFPGMSFETHPQLGGDVEVDTGGMKDDLEQYMNGLQRYLITKGMAVKPLAPQVVDPTPQIKTQLEAICIKLEMPMRIFMGSERGELSSEQDSGEWSQKVNARRNNYATPRIIIPLIDRLILIGVLPKPKGGGDKLAGKVPGMGQNETGLAKSGMDIDEDEADALLKGVGKPGATAPEAEEEEDIDLEGEDLEDLELEGPATKNMAHNFGGGPPAPPPKINYPKKPGQAPAGPASADKTTLGDIDDDEEDEDPLDREDTAIDAEGKAGEGAIAEEAVGPDGKPIPTEEEKKGYSIEWPDGHQQTKMEKAQIALAEVQADSAYIAGNVQSLIPPLSYLVETRGMDEEKAQQLLQQAEESALEAEAQQMAQAEQQMAQQEMMMGASKAAIDEGVVPDPVYEQDIKMKAAEKGVNPMPPTPGPGGFGGGPPQAGMPMGGGGPPKPPGIGGPPKPPGPPKPKMPALNAVYQTWVTGNEFCATGQGGGVDATCSPDGSAAAPQGGGVATSDRVKESVSMADRDKAGNFTSATAVAKHLFRGAGSIAAIPVKAVASAIEDFGDEAKEAIMGELTPRIINPLKAVVDEDARSEAAAVVKGLFAKMTLGTGPLAIGAIKLGIKAAPHAFRLMVDGFRGIGKAAKWLAEGHKVDSPAKEAWKEGKKMMTGNAETGDLDTSEWDSFLKDMDSKKVDQDMLQDAFEKLGRLEELLQDPEECEKLAYALKIVGASTNDPLINVFCATGPGGGKDPTCKLSDVGEGGSYGGSSDPKPSELTPRLAKLLEGAKEIPFQERDTSTAGSRLANKPQETWLTIGDPDKARSAIYEFETDAGMGYRIDISSDDYIEGHEGNYLSFEDEKNRVSTTGAGSAAEVMSNVMQAVAAWVAKKAPATLYWSGSGKGRVGLYQRLAKTMAKAFPQYVAMTKWKPGKTIGSWMMVHKDLVDQVKAQSATYYGSSEWQVANSRCTENVANWEVVRPYCDDSWLSDNVYCGSYGGTATIDKEAKISPRLRALAEQAEDVPFVAYGSGIDLDAWKGSGDYWSYKFEVGRGTAAREFLITTTKNYKGLDIIFADEDGRFGVTGKGDAHEIFSKVSLALAALVEKMDPDTITFTASPTSGRDFGTKVKGEPSRVKLYSRLSKTLAKMYPSRVVLTKPYMGDGKYYTIAKEDAVDYVQRTNPDYVIANQAADDSEEYRDSWFHEVAWNAFCPTGKGGGVDPSCPSTGLKSMYDRAGSIKEPISDDEIDTFTSAIKSRDEAVSILKSMGFSSLKSAGKGKVAKDIGKRIRDRRDAALRTSLAMGSDWLTGGAKPKTGKRRTANQFCATGEGGGVDPSCSPDDEAKAVAKEISDKWAKGREGKGNKIRTNFKARNKAIQIESDYKHIYGKARKDGKSDAEAKDYAKKSLMAYNLYGAGSVTENQFCATGEGGGVDPTCGKGEGKAGADSIDTDKDGKVSKAEFDAKRGHQGEGKTVTKPIAPGERPKKPSTREEISKEETTQCDPCSDPDVIEDRNNDGVTDQARVGVGAMEVPPPPSIGRIPNLTPEERAVEELFIKNYEEDPDGYAADYRRIIEEKYDKKGQVPTFGTDDAKDLATAWTESDQVQRSENRATLNIALHSTANAVAKRAFLQELDKLKPGDEIMVTVGGCGAGKGYALDNDKEGNPFVPQAAEVKGRSKVVWDNAGDQNATENPWVQEEAEARGLKVNYVFVHADPKEQWDNKSRGVIARASKPENGRMVDAEVFADSYAIGARNHQSFYEDNKDNPNASFIFLQNKGPKPQLLPGIPKEALEIDRDALRDHAVKTLEESDAPDHIKRGGLMGGGRIWARKGKSKQVS